MNKVHAALMRAQHLQHNGGWHEAQAIYHDVLQAFPRHPGALTGLADLLASKGRTDDALRLYEDALESENDYFPALMGRARLLISLGEPEEALEELEMAEDIVPGSAEVFVLKGYAYLDLNWTKEAADAFRQALSIDPGIPGIEEQLIRISSDTIPLWHFTMLVDHARNEAYCKAIEKAVKPGMHVLDIGAGTGLLSMMAARSGAAQVTCVEMGKEMAAVARRVIERNGYSDRINVYKMHSGWLKIGEHLPRPVDIVVSEIVDAALLGEGVLPSLRHAWASLAAPGAVMIPAAASVWGIVAQLPVASLNNVEGFDLSDLAVYHYPGGTRNIRLQKEAHTPVCSPFRVADFDFQDIPDEVMDENPIWKEIEILAEQDGTANVVVIWFQLHLDHEITVGSGPYDTMDHWGQLAYYLPEPIHVQSGSTFKIRVGRNDKRWWFRGK